MTTPQPNSAPAAAPAADPPFAPAPATAPPAPRLGLDASFAVPSAAGPPFAPAAPAAPEVRLDALMPAEMAAKAAESGVRKAALAVMPTFVLAILAGAFIALGAAFATTVSAGAAGELPYGIVKLVAGLAFSLGLILVIVGGAELFTGNNLLAMAWASRRISTGAVVRNWVIVYAGNFVGAVGTAVLVVAAGQYAFGGGSVGAVALGTAATKVGYEPLQAFVLGILCNGLVCLAVWLTYSARTTADRILAIVPPIAAFVAMGFEHSVANMYFIPAGMLIRAVAPESFWAAIGATPADYAALDWAGLLGNLVPVTLGNIVGGTILVGAVYWLVYLRGKR
jgi:formate transporter